MINIVEFSKEVIMTGKTLRCTKEFMMFEQGAAYYCFAEDEDYLYMWYPKGYCGVNEIKVTKDSAKKNFKIDW
jgi:hypothetical protein